MMSYDNIMLQVNLKTNIGLANHKNMYHTDNFKQDA